MAKRNSKHIKAQKKGKELDEYMCFFCLNIFKGNHGHHIILYSEDGNASVNNIITLCPKCHREYHSGKLSIEVGRF
jgi:5-methylcytosine-specific restriction endonuclease McrA